MAESRPGPGRIFISYRREETAYPAGWLFDRLTDHFGSGQIFKDVDSIELGDDFAEVISTAVGSCDVLLALIGDRWLTITDENGRRRLDDPSDFVRVEIEAALTRNVRVIPILVDGARIPRADEVPPSLVKLVRRQALELSPSRFDFDTSRLLKVLDSTLGDVRTAPDDAPSKTAETKAQDRNRKEPQKAAGRAGHAGRTSAATITPAVAAASDEPSDAHKSPDKQSRSVSTRARILLGIGVAVVIIVVLIVAIVANSPVTSKDDFSGRADSPVIFQDDFSGRASGWEDVHGESIGGHYSNSAYSIYVKTRNPDGLSWGAHPRNEENLFPNAPPNLIIKVEAEKIAGGSDPNDGYGILCRADRDENSDYSFIVGNDHVTIGKFVAGDRFKTLDSAAIPAVEANATSRLQAECSSVEGQQAVHLELSVNGNVVADATDSKDPLLTGTIELFVYTVETIEVEFDNFVVKRSSNPS
jgi:hypothetical protein